MLTYTQLNHTADGIPRWNTLFEPVLTIIQQKKQWSTRQLKIDVANALELPDKLRIIRYDKVEGSQQNIIESRIGFALSLLKNAGLVDTVQRGSVAPSDVGRGFLEQNQGHITEELIKALPQYPSYQEERKQRQQAKKATDGFSLRTDEPLDLEHSINSLVEDFNIDIANDLLNRILAKDPGFFEQLTIHLLAKMGYSGTDGIAQATQATNDRGIDGIIQEDPLGTRTIYIQAKRYSKDNHVQRPEIQAFYGALSEMGSDKGVFITTSTFTRTAIESAHSFGNINLIDGQQLTDLMLRYEVGVTIRKTFKLLDIDEDYFIEE